MYPLSLMNPPAGDAASPLRIILAENHQIVRHGIGMLINAQPDMEVIAEAGTGTEIIAILSSGISADILITDIDVPGMERFELLQQIREQHAKIRTLILSMSDTQFHIQKAFELGCAAYLFKSVDSRELLFAIRHVAIGKEYLCSEAAIRLLRKDQGKKIISPPPYPSIEFSGRESEILSLIALGMTNVEIAEQLFLSKRTVEGHRQNLLEKTGCRNTAALIRYAAINGYLD